MKEIKLETKIRIYSLAELPEEESRLMEAAIKATGQSYAPYSKFHVGAAALLEDGTIITGSNQENAAYPSGLCAERVALFHAGCAVRKRSWWRRVPNHCCRFVLGRKI